MPAFPRRSHPPSKTRNETLIVLLADTGLRVSELVALDWEYLDLDAEPGELYLPSEIQKGNPGASYLDLADETRRQLRRYRIASGKTVRRSSRRDRPTE